jgi:nucleoside-diphosphate-sugar epimerase
MMDNTKRIALVLGATGGIGGEMARQLVARGWHVRALQRNPDALEHRNATLEWVRGDAMVREDVVAAARGTELIIHAVNPPGYRNWAGQVLPMIDNTIAAARASGARIVLPGTVYNFGPETFPVLRETSAQQPLTRKGKLRAEMERRLQAASADGVHSLIVRAGDFFGPQTGNNWFAAALVRPGKAVGTVIRPGARGVGHQWAYLPDAAETMLRLIELGDRLPDFAVYHMRAHWVADGTLLPRTIGRAVARQVKTRAFPWWVLPLLSPFSETMREMREMRYLWQQPMRMDNAKLVQALGAEPHTPWDEAVGTTLRSLGCH